MTYKKDTKLTFDVSGGLLPDGQVSIGCQTVPLGDLARVAGDLSVSDKAVRATGIVGTADGDRKVEFEGTDRWFTESQILDVARNLQSEEPAPPKPAWTTGDVVRHTVDGTVFVKHRDGDKWVSSIDTRLSQWDTGQIDRWKDSGLIEVLRQQADTTPTGPVKVGDRVQTVSRTGSQEPGSLGTVVATPDQPGSHSPTHGYIAVKMDGLNLGGYYGSGVYRLSDRVGASDEYRRVGAADPSTLSWQDGDRIRLDRTGHVRERRNGRWYTNGNSNPNSWYDADYDEALARGGERWTVLRKGGVDLVALAA